MPISKERHLRISAHRAEDFIAAGDLGGAVQCFVSDLGKHDETKHLAMPNTYNEGRECKTKEAMRKWIDDVITRANSG